MKKFTTHFILLLTAAFFFSSCSEKIMGGKGSHLTLLSDRAIEAQSAEAYHQMLAKSQKCTDRVINGIVQRAANRVIEATRVYYEMNGKSKEFDQFKWEVNVVEDPNFNAFCMAGGKIWVNTGVFAVVESEDELASIIGHEVGHALARHTNVRMSQNLLAQLGAAAVEVATYNESPYNREMAMETYNVLAQFGLLLPFSRAHESEADNIGLRLMTIAGYDPSAAPRLWGHVIEKTGGRSMAFFDTHPTEERRIHNLEAAIPEAVAFAQPYRRHLENDGPGSNEPMLADEEEDLSTQPNSRVSEPTMLAPGSTGFVPKNKGMDETTPKGPAPKTAPVEKPVAKIIVFKIQIKAVADASSELPKLTSLGTYGVLTTEPTTVEGKRFERIILGEFKNLDEARKLKWKLMEQGFDQACIFQYENGERTRIAN